MTTGIAEDTGALPLAGRRFGRYEVLTQLAAGGMATIFVARARGVAGFERLVAMKVLHPHLAHETEFITMFLDEARLAARIRHPNVVGTLDISDSEGDGYFLVMEYIEGDNLGELLRAASVRGERISPRVGARIVLDALSGLSAAHRLTDESGTPIQLVHRDVSPHNVMVGVDGIARLTDFGVAKAEVRLTSTREGQFKGKLSYMAPEQASTGEADQRADLFSMGILLWETLTGRRLFRANTNAEVVAKILHGRIEPVSSIVPSCAAYDPVVARALARDPAERYQTADELTQALEETARIHGLATAREVGDAVSSLLAEKLDTERRRIREAITILGHSEISNPSRSPTPLPRPREGSGHRLSSPTPRISHTPAPGQTVGGRPSNRPLPPERPEPASPSFRTATIAIIVIACGVVLGVAVPLFLTTGSNESIPVESQPLPNTPNPAPTTAPDDFPPVESIFEPEVAPIGTAPIGTAEETSEQEDRATEEAEEADPPVRPRRRRPRPRSAMTRPEPAMEQPTPELAPTMATTMATDPDPPAPTMQAQSDDLLANPYLH